MKKFYFCLVVLLLFVFSSPVSAVKLLDNIHTGIPISTVKKNLNQDLSVWKTGKKLKFYQIGDHGLYLIFSKCSNKLMYKIFIYSSNTANKYEKKVKKFAGDGIKRGNTVFIERRI